MLEVANINVFHGDLQALWDVCITVKEREIVVICGSNGAGKSTLLYTVIGACRPKQGSVKFLGQNIDNLRSYDRVGLGISIVPEGARVFPYTSVQDNLELGAYIQKDRKKQRDNLDFIYSLFPILEERGRQFGGTLSGGERQMLAIGRALMSEPKLLLLDEPTAGLAPLLRINVFKSISEINKGKGISILLSEQSLLEALQLADRAYVLETGRIVLSGTGDEVLNNDMVKTSYLGL